jgi:hypothetical protein
MLAKKEGLSGSHAPAWKPILTYASGMHSHAGAWERGQIGDLPDRPYNLTYVDSYGPKGKAIYTFFAAD